MRNFLKLNLFLTIVAIILFTVPVNGQTSNGTILGTITTDAERTMTKDGKSYITIHMCTIQNVKKGVGDVEYHTIIARGKIAPNVKTLTKGSTLYVEGSNHTKRVTGEVLSSVMVVCCCVCVLTADNAVQNSVATRHCAVVVGTAALRFIRSQTRSLTRNHEWTVLR